MSVILCLPGGRRSTRCGVFRPVFFPSMKMSHGGLAPSISTPGSPLPKLLGAMSSTSLERARRDALRVTGAMTSVSGAAATTASTSSGCTSILLGGATTSEGSSEGATAGLSKAGLSPAGLSRGATAGGSAASVSVASARASAGSLPASGSWVLSTSGATTGRPTAALATAC